MAPKMAWPIEVTIVALVLSPPRISSTLLSESTERRNISFHLGQPQVTVDSTFLFLLWTAFRS